ncbi:glycoside hydrolase family 26 protein [Streptomyces sp. NPDC012888]|uniref:glycoside hydrolase family 26 protein n=1 Tax=Streptomyces sp. NPDC012888 TaxID=3364855 RepID=UPI0036893BE1
MSRPRRRLVSACVGTVTAGLLATGAALSAPEDDEPSEADVAVGAYLDYGPNGVARIPRLSRWLGGREIRVGHTYLPGDRWSNIAGSPNFLEDWAAWRRADPDRMFVLNVPMQERNEERVPDHEVARLIRAGAEGRFDRHFRELAERLVSLGVPDTVIVLGWEMNGTTYTHRCAPDPRNWKKYWRRVVDEMRSVPGQRFRFDFAPNRGTDAIGWTECYPGDDHVDIIGMDSYDQGPGHDFDDMVRQPYGLQHHVDFAKAHGKRTSYPEWGLFRRGDNPEYVRRMLKWIDQHKPLYHTITDYCPHGVWQCKSNPRSTAVFRDLMWKIPDPVVPTPQIPTPQIPSPQVTPQVPTPQVPTPVVPTPVLPSPVLPSPAEPFPDGPVEPSPQAPSPSPSPAAPDPGPDPLEPEPEPTATPTRTPAPSPVVPEPEVPAATPTPTPTPTPKATPTPTEPVPPRPEPQRPPLNSREWCVPLNFGEWLNKLLGNQTVCVTLPWEWPF